jgi:hypothetical protein
MAAHGEDQRDMKGARRKASSSNPPDDDRPPSIGTSFIDAMHAASPGVPRVVVLIGMWAILALTVGSFGLAVLEHGCGSESQGSTTAP